MRSEESTQNQNKYRNTKNDFASSQVWAATPRKNQAGQNQKLVKNFVLTTPLQVHSKLSELLNKAQGSNDDSLKQPVIPLVAYSEQGRRGTPDYKN